MNETFAKILQFSIMFWIFLTLFSTIYANRINTYMINDDNLNDLEDSLSSENLSLLSGVTILFDIMTFQIVEYVPYWISIILDLIFVLTGVSIIMAITNR